MISKVWQKTFPRYFVSSASLRIQQSRVIRHATFLRSLPNCDESKDSSPTVAKLKNPIVEKLWSARHQAKLMMENQRDMDSPFVASTSASKADAECIIQSSESEEGKRELSKSPSCSETSIDYPFSSDNFLRESYRNPWGQMRFGKILEDLDAMAGNVAFNHVGGQALIVTAGVDRIRIRKKPSIDLDQLLTGKVTWVGKSSMEIRMQLKSSGEEDEWLEAYFTFVTLDPKTKRPMKISKLSPQSNEERAHFELGAMRAKAKKIARRSKQFRVGEQLSEGSLAIDKLAAELLKEAGPLLRMPSLADSNSILMSQTEMQNALIAQPQVRNLSDRIFGGFLMRRGLELAYASAYLFGGDKPNFLEVDDISFDSPVDVGDLLVFKSRILYTQPDGGDLGEYVEDHKDMPLVIVEVEAWVTEPEAVDARVSNVFYFTFALPNKKSCRNVLPGNLEEARRMAIRMVADKEQASLRS